MSHGPNVDSPPQRPSTVDGDARIRVTTTTNAVSFSDPVTAANEAFGHQAMPSLAFAGGKLMLVYYDVRETAAQVFGKYIGTSPRPTRATPATASARPSTSARRSARSVPTLTFAPSVKVSDYLMGYRNSTAVLEQLQINPPNLPIFKLGTVPFIGDYIDLTPTPAFVPAAGGRWVYNTAASASFPVFHTTWTDNRDVRAPLDGNWANYTPPTIVGGTGQSLFDPSRQSPSATPATPAPVTRTFIRHASAAAFRLALRATPSNSQPRCSAVSRCSRRTTPRRRKPSA